VSGHGMGEEGVQVPTHDRRQEVITVQTEGSYHSGTINMKDLKKEWKYYYELPFPKFPNEEKYGDLFAELVEIDGFIAGIVQSFLKGKNTDRKLIHVVEEYNIKLNAVKPSESDPGFADWIALKNYKDELDKMIKMVIMLYDKLNIR
jgi:hypothetical protein